MYLIATCPLSEKYVVHENRISVYTEIRDSATFAWIANVMLSQKDNYVILNMADLAAASETKPSFAFSRNFASQCPYWLVSNIIHISD
jgi:hypothetical protein